MQSKEYFESLGFKYRNDFDLKGNKIIEYENDELIIRFEMYGHIIIFANKREKENNKLSYIAFTPSVAMAIRKQWAELGWLY